MIFSCTPAGCFNPRPVYKPGDTQYRSNPSGARNVSIHARFISRAIPGVQFKETEMSRVSIHARFISRAILSAVCAECASSCVSIHARFISRAIRIVNFLDLDECRVSIHARFISRAIPHCCNTLLMNNFLYTRREWQAGPPENL